MFFIFVDEINMVETDGQNQYDLNYFFCSSVRVDSVAHSVSTHTMLLWSNSLQRLCTVYIYICNTFLCVTGNNQV